MGRMELCAQDDAAMMSGDPNRIGIFFERAHQLGVTHIRMMIYIHETAPCLGAAGQANLAHYGNLVQQVIQNGFQPQLVLTGVAASWGNACGMSTGARPSLQAWRQFVAAVVPYFYSLGARRFSMWNEANYPSFLCAGSVTSGSNVDRSKCHASLKANAELYAQIYQAGYQTIRYLQKVRRLGGGVQIFFGDFAGNGIATMDYIVRRHKIVTDGYAWHPYQYCTNPKTGRLATRSCRLRMGGISTTGQLRSKLQGWHRSGRLRTPRGGPVPMYMTEFGYHINEPGVSIPTSVAAKWWPQVLDVAASNGAKGFNIYQFWPTPPGVWDTSILLPNGNAAPTFYGIYAWARRHHYRQARL